MEGLNGLITDRNLILHHITTYYESIADGTDNEMKVYIQKAHLESQMIDKQEEAEEILRTKKSKSKIKKEGPQRSFNYDITKDELRKAIMRMKKHKAVGVDNFPNECYKHGGDRLMDYILALFNACFKLKYAPDKWQDSQTILLYKKGDPCHIKNYRPITLLNSIFKLWERVLETRLRAHMEVNNLSSVL